MSFDIEKKMSSVFRFMPKLETATIEKIILFDRKYNEEHSLPSLFNYIDIEKVVNDAKSDPWFEYERGGIIYWIALDNDYFSRYCFHIYLLEVGHITKNTKFNLYKTIHSY